jgi:hypothetical protein
LLHGIKCSFVGNEIKLLYFSEIGVCELLKDVPRFNVELDWTVVVSAEDVQYFLETDAVAIYYGVVFELMDELILLCGIF